MHVFAKRRYHEPDHGGGTEFCFWCHFNQTSNRFTNFPVEQQFLLSTRLILSIKPKFNLIGLEQAFAKSLESLFHMYKARLENLRWWCFYLHRKQVTGIFLVEDPISQQR